MLSHGCPTYPWNASAIDSGVRGELERSTRPRSLLVTGPKGAGNNAPGSQRCTSQSTMHLVVNDTPSPSATCLKSAAGHRHPLAGRLLEAALRLPPACSGAPTVHSARLTLEARRACRPSSSLIVEALLLSDESERRVRRKRDDTRARAKMVRGREPSWYAGESQAGTRARAKMVRGRDPR